MPVRPVQSRADMAIVAALAREIWTEHYTPIIGPGQVAYMLERFQSPKAIAEQIAEGYAYYLVDHVGEPAGYLALVAGEDRERLFLSKIYVRSALRGHGYGKELLGFAVSECRRLGAGVLWLTVNRHNDQTIAWYERMGFVKAAPVVADIGGGYVMDDWRMELSVDARG